MALPPTQAHVANAHFRISVVRRRTQLVHKLPQPRLAWILNPGSMQKPKQEVARPMLGERHEGSSGKREFRGNTPRIHLREFIQ